MHHDKNKCNKVTLCVGACAVSGSVFSAAPHSFTDEVRIMHVFIEIALVAFSLD